MAKCLNCGSATGPGDKFCAVCGRPVAAEAPPTDPAPAKPAAPAKSTPTAKPVVAAKPAASSGGTAPNVVVVNMPGWVAGDWSAAGLLALSALLVGAVIQMVVGGLLLLFVQVLLDAPISWGDSLRAPLDMFISFHGPIDQLGLWATGVLWIFIAFRLASRVAGVDEPARQGLPARRLAFVAKTAFLYIVPVTILAAVLDPGAGAPINDPFGTLPFFPSWSVAATFFLGFIASAGAVLWSLSRRTGQSVWAFSGGGRFDPPKPLRAAWSGAKSTVKLAFPWLLVLLVLGTFLEALSNDFAVAELMVFVISLLVAVVLWAGVDIAALFFITASRFFTGDAFVGPDMPGWFWIGAAIVGLSFLIGGFRAARTAEPRTAAEAVGVGLLVGPLVGLIMFVLSWFLIGIGEDLAGPALGLPIIWGIVSALGGFLFANRSGLVSGVSVEFRTTGSATPQEGAPSD